jgi:hypothetical protein
LIADYSFAGDDRFAYARFSMIFAIIFAAQAFFFFATLRYYLIRRQDIDC